MPSVLVVLCRGSVATNDLHRYERRRLARPSDRGFSGCRETKQYLLNTKRTKKPGGRDESIECSFADIGGEPNLIEPATNYGWPLVSQGRHYDGPRISRYFWSEGMAEPVVLWAPSGLEFYSGDVSPDWQGNLFVSSMMTGRIAGTGHLERIVFNDGGEEIARQSLLADQRQRIGDVRQGPDGLLYLLTEENNGARLRLERAAD